MELTNRSPAPGLAGLVSTAGGPRCPVALPSGPELCAQTFIPRPPRPSTALARGAGLRLGLGAARALGSGMWVLLHPRAGDVLVASFRDGDSVKRGQWQRAGPAGHTCASWELGGGRRVGDSGLLGCPSSHLPPISGAQQVFGSGALVGAQAGTGAWLLPAGTWTGKGRVPGQQVGWSKSREAQGPGQCLFCQLLAVLRENQVSVYPHSPSFWSILIREYFYWCLERVDGGRRERGRRRRTDISVRDTSMVASCIPRPDPGSNPQPQHMSLTGNQTSDPLPTKQHEPGPDLPPS